MSIQTDYPIEVRDTAQALIKRFQDLQLASQENQERIGSGSALEEYEIPSEIPSESPLAFSTTSEGRRISRLTQIPDDIDQYIEAIDISMPQTEFEERMKVERMPSYRPREEIQDRCMKICLPDEDMTRIRCIDVCLESQVLNDIAVTEGKKGGVIVIDEDILRGVIHLNGRAYTTAEIVEYLYSKNNRKSIPHTGQSISDQQASNIISLIARGNDNIVASLTSDIAYAVEDENIGQRQSDITLLDEMIIDRIFENGDVPTLEFYALAFQYYTTAISAITGFQFKNAINFCVARFINRVGELSQPFSMGIDLELISWLLQNEASGVKPCPENYEIVRNQMVEQFNIPVELADRYVIPWVTGLCCVLNDTEYNYVKESIEMGTFVAGAVESLKMEMQVNSTRQDMFAGRAPILPYLTDEDFVQRILQVDPEILDTIAREVGIIGSEERECIEPYVIYESNLSKGLPISPPVSKSISPKLMKMLLSKGMQQRVGEIISKVNCIQFVGNC